jgi:hypothetical protein
MKIPLLALSLSLCSAAAFAALGGAPSTPVPRVLSSSTATAASAPASASAFSESNRTLESGTEVHEWVNAAGIVFAISWSGPFLPDLREQLGTHFQALTDSQQRNNPGSRSRVSVQQADLVIFSGGRMGAFEGRAWIPSLLPAGFDTAAIK